jgi:hypothetical protein
LLVRLVFTFAPGRGRGVVDAKEVLLGCAGGRFGQQSWAWR